MDTVHCLERAAVGWSIRFNLSECEQGLIDVRIIFVSLFVHVFVYAQPAGSIHLNPSECEQGLTDGGRLGRRRIALRIAHQLPTSGETQDCPPQLRETQGAC